MSDEAPIPRTQQNGAIVAPTLYPRLLRNVANLCEALTAFEQPDPANQESPHYVAHAKLAIYNEELAELPHNKDKPNAGLVGWVVQEDVACWVFVPYAPEIEDAPVGGVRGSEASDE